MHSLENHTPEYGAPEAYSIQFAASPAVTEALRPFYKPSRADQKLGQRAILYSVETVPLMRLPGNRHEYPSNPKDGVRNINAFQSRQLDELKRRKLAFPLLSSARVLQKKNSQSLRIELTAGVKPEQASMLRVQPEFRAAADRQYMNVVHDIPASSAMENDVMLEAAMRQLFSALRLNHPAAAADIERLPLSERYVGEGYTLEVAKNALIRRPWTK